MDRKRLVRLLVLIAGMALVFFVLLWIGFAVQSQRAYQTGEQALKEGADILAQGYFDRAIRYRTPFNFWAERAADRIELIAQQYEAKGRLLQAIDAYERLAAALAATSTGWSRARRERIEELQGKIKSLREQVRSKNNQ